MIKLVVTDLGGTFLDSNAQYDRSFFKHLSCVMRGGSVHFAVCTGKQLEKVEALFEKEIDKIWVLADSAAGIKRGGEVLYQATINNQLGLKIISRTRCAFRK